MIQVKMAYSLMLVACSICQSFNFRAGLKPQNFELTGISVSYGTTKY